MTTPFVLELEDGKYTVTNYYGVIKAERYREPWRDLTGDKLVGAMLSEILDAADNPDDPFECVKLGLSFGIRLMKEDDEPMPLTEEPLKDETGQLIQSTIRNNGKPFRCDCGCNVFHRPDKTRLSLYQCNACEQRFDAE